MESGKEPDGAGPDAPGGPDAPVYAATLRPHRSLGRRGFRTLMVACALVAAAASLRVIALGFWPVSGFFLLDLVGLYVAFRVSYHRARFFEEVVLTRVELLVRKTTPRGIAGEWRLNPLWTRLRRETHEEFGIMRLALVSGRTSVDLARDLSPGEREQVADGLGRALASVKRGY